MNQRTLATLLSALVFPGLGQLVILKRPRRGLAFMLPALAAFGWLMYGLWQNTSVLLDEALSGRLAPDPVAIAERLHQQGTLPGTDAASWILLICWIASVIDALRTKGRN